MFDSHIHTDISFDSDMVATRAVQALREQNCGGVFTEHYDLAYPVAGEFLFDPKTYFDRYAKFRNEQVFLGVELGMVTGNKEEADNLLEGQPFDYVIGSIHVVENVDIYYPEFYQGRSKLVTYGAYFKAMQACVREYDFDALGHIDYISRYAPYPETNVWLEPELKEAIEEVLRLLIASDRVLEFNTKTIINETDYQRVLPIYKRYHALGGRFVTIGSDAHSPEGIGWKCQEAQEVLASIGLTTVAYKERKRIIL